MERPALFPLVAVCVLLVSGCGNKNDDDRPPKPAEPPAPVTVAPIAAEPPTAEPAPAPPPPTGAPAPAAPAKPGGASTAAPKQGPGQATPPIPTHMVPKPLQPYVPKDLPKVPANLPIPN